MKGDRGTNMESNYSHICVVLDLRTGFLIWTLNFVNHALKTALLTATCSAKIASCAPLTAKMKGDRGTYMESNCSHSYVVLDLQTGFCIKRFFCQIYGLKYVLHYECSAKQNFTDTFFEAKNDSLCSSMSLGVWLVVLCSLWTKSDNLLTIDLSVMMTARRTSYKVVYNSYIYIFKP
jgi:hypothetical protein